MAQNPSYLHRMTTLFSVNLLVEVCSSEVVQASMLPVVLRLAQDPVANVRFNAAKTLNRLCQKMDGRCAPCLQGVMDSSLLLVCPCGTSRC